MKKILMVAAAAGLMSLAACGGGVTNTAAENAEASHEANASIYSDAADNTTNVVAENVLDSAAANEQNAADAAEANKH